MSERQERIMELLRERGPLSTNQIAEATGCNPTCALHSIKGLIRCEMVREVSTEGTRLKMWEAVE